MSSTWAIPHEGQDLSAEPPEPDRRAELAVIDGAHHAGDIVDDDKNDQGIEQPVPAAKEIAEPAANHRKRSLNGIPEIFHFAFLHNYKCREPVFADSRVHEIRCRNRRAGASDGLPYQTSNYRLLSDSTLCCWRHRKFSGSLHSGFL